MHVLLITDELLPGGVARHVIDLAHGLASKGVDVTVAATDGLWRNSLVPKIEFIDIGLLRKNSFQKSIFGFPRAVIRLKRYVSRHKIDIIHSHKRYSDMIGRILSKRFTIPHVSTCHNTFNTKRVLSVFGNVTIAPSRAIETMLYEKYNLDTASVRQIHLGRQPLRKYTQEERKNFRSLLGIEEHKRIVASVGRIVADKDRGTLLQAMKLLDEQKALDDVVFVVLGDGDLKPAMIERMHKLHLSQRIKFLGSDCDIEGLFNVAEFCVLSSIRDGGTLYVNLEAASLSKPHIATRVGGIPEFVIHERTGLLVEPKNPKQLAEQIKRLLDDPAFVKTLGAHAYQLFCQRHTYDRFINLTLDVYKHLEK